MAIGNFNQQTPTRVKKPKKPKEQPQRANIPFAQKSNKNRYQIKLVPLIPVGNKEIILDF